MRQQPHSKFIIKSKFMYRKQRNYLIYTVQEQNNLRKTRNPAQKTINMFFLYSMAKQSQIMDEFSSPLCKGMSFMLKDLPIPDCPNVPTSCNEDVHEERIAKSFPSCNNCHENIIAMAPVNLQIRPNSPANAAAKK